MPVPSLLSLDPPLPGEAAETSEPTVPVFGIDVGFGGDETVVSVRGEVDRVSAPTLSAVMSAQIARAEQCPLVLDLAALTFMDAGGYP